MRHTCPDGTSTRLVRSGPVGSDGPDVTFSCPRCGWTRTADIIGRDVRIVAAAIVAAAREGKSL